MTSAHFRHFKFKSTCFDVLTSVKVEQEGKVTIINPDHQCIATLMCPISWLQML